MTLSNVRKALVPLVPAVGAGVTYFAEHGHDVRWLYAAALQFLTAVGVYTVKNKKKAKVVHDVVFHAPAADLASEMVSAP